MENYHLFIDESGDPSLKSINHDFPIFALLGILISDKEYEKLNSEFDKIKVKYFGSKNVILHSRDIRKCDGVFAKLFDLKTKESFYKALDEAMENTDYKIISSVIKKQEHINRYGKLADDPYEIGLTFVLERTLFELDELNGFANVMIESRGKNEDSNLAAKYNELMTRGSHQVISSRFMSRLSSKADFRRKSDNDNGLQMADLCAFLPLATYYIQTNFIQHTTRFLVSLESQIAIVLKVTGSKYSHKKQQPPFRALAADRGHPGPYFNYSTVL